MTSCSRPYEQQIRQIRAGDKQHKNRCGGQKNESAFGIAAERRYTVAGVSQFNSLLVELGNVILTEFSLCAQPLLQLSGELALDRCWILPGP